MKQLKLAVAVFFLILGLAGVSAAQDQSAQYLQAGNTLYSQKNYDQAIRYYQAAVQFNPNSWQAYQGLGGCYYAKGDNANALTNYQKSLDLNPNNPQVSQFVTYLKSQSAAPPLPGGNSTSATSTNPAASQGAFKPGFELSVGPGVAIDSGGTEGLGIGGGLSGFYMMDKNLGFGGMIRYYSFSYSYVNTYDYYNSSFVLGTETDTTNDSIGTLEVVAALKYKFDGNGLVPYLVGGVGLVDLMVSDTTKYSYSNGDPYYGAQPDTSSSASGMDPVVVGGAGVELSMGKDMNLFAEARLDIIIGNGGTATLVPIDAGLSFNL